MISETATAADNVPGAVSTEFLVMTSTSAHNPDVTNYDVHDELSNANEQPVDCQINTSSFYDMKKSTDVKYRLLKVIAGG